MQVPAPHILQPDQLYKAFNSSDSGLNEDEARRRKGQFGPNELPKGRRISWFKLLTKQFKSLLVLILLFAAVISWFSGEIIDTWVIVVVVIVNAGIGFSQEFRAEKAISSLERMLMETAKVIRTGDQIIVHPRELVPGDLVVLEEGDRVPADGRIIFAKSLRTVESALTGESLPISKHANAIDLDTVMADRKNMVWKSTLVAGGFARMVVTGTGANTAIGEISTSLGGFRRRRSSFMKKTDLLARQMTAIAIGSAALIFLIGWLIRDMDLEEVLMMSIAALVAAVPEGLPAVIAIVLAIGANRMAKRNAIVREFTATETLGSVTTILTDKTGTLTQNELTVRKVYVPGIGEFEITGEGWFPVGNFKQNGATVDPDRIPLLKQLLKIAAVSNNSQIHPVSTNGKDSGNSGNGRKYQLSGDPTEGALTVLAQKGGLNPESLKAGKLDDLPFDSQIKMRATLYAHGDQRNLYVVGAPERVLGAATSIQTISGEIPLSNKYREEIKQVIDQWSGDAMRVIALASRSAYNKDNISPGELTELTFAGLTGMIDPPRPDAMEAVRRCKKAGIRVIMVTGDHLNTAVAVATATGIIGDNDKGNVLALDQKQLEELSESEFDNVIQRVNVFARLTPKMKLHIASRLQTMGELIAMTGDGVNDAPALKKADVGVSMGRSGTDVARDTSDVVLADDNFASIVNAVEEGRIVFTNARQTSFFLITTNIAETVTLLIPISMGWPLPLIATQILWLNLVTDGVTDMALAAEPGHGDVMDPLALRNGNILNRKIIGFLLINVVIMAGLTLTAFVWYFSDGIKKARTATFVVMALTQMFNVFNLRSLDRSVFRIGFFSNKWINLAIGVSVALLIAVTELPFLANLFHFESLPRIDFLVLCALSSTVLWAGETYKYVRYLLKFN